MLVLGGPDHPDGGALGAAQLQRLVVEGRELPVAALLLVRPLVAGQVKCYANHWVRFVAEGWGRPAGTEAPMRAWEPKGGCSAPAATCFSLRHTGLGERPADFLVVEEEEVHSAGGGSVARPPAGEVCHGDGVQETATFYLHPGRSNSRGPMTVAGVAVVAAFGALLALAGVGLVLLEARAARARRAGPRPLFEAGRKPALPRFGARMQ